MVLQAYEEWGTEAFDRFNGMFGLAILDRHRDQLVLARDHFGIKPLYWANAGTEQDPRLLFASEIKPILATGLVEARPNERILYRYLQYRIHDDTEETFFDGVRKLLPGEMMTVDLATSRFRISSYTRLREELAELAKVNTPYTQDVVDEFFAGRLSRREFLRKGSLVGLSMPLLGGILAACGSSGTTPSGTVATRCPFCATPVQRSDVRDAPARLPVDGVVPFGIDQKQDWTYAGEKLVPSAALASASESF